MKTNSPKQTLESSRKLIRISKPSSQPASQPVLTTILLAMTLSLSLSKSLFAAAWDSDNDPSEMASDYERNFERLNAVPESILPNEKMPWSDDYYRDDHEGIAVRFDKDGSEVWNYSRKNLAELKKMTLEEIAMLSPPEKLDIYNGEYNYPLTKQVRKSSADRSRFLGIKITKTDRSWEGICHGWTSASINHAEPEAVTLKNKDGIIIPFGSSDVKALLSYSYTARSGSGYLDEDAKQVGNRCGTPAEKLKKGEKPDLTPVEAECSDLNPGTFHIVLLNQIAIKKQDFIADIDNMIEVWNQPIAGYKTEVLPESLAIYPDAAPGTAKVVRVRTRMDYVSEISPMWEPVVGTKYQSIKHPEYEYTLELNSAGDIIGGKWEKINTEYVRTVTDPATKVVTKTNYWKFTEMNQRGKRQHPDFFWITKKAPRDDYWSGFMKNVYKARNFSK